MARTVATALTHILRDNHYVLNSVTGLYERSTLLELARTNICLQSETFDNATWTKTRCSISANADTAPDGTLTADRLVEDGTAANTHVTVQAITITANATVAFSVFLKAGTRTWATLTLTDAATGGANANFQKSINLSTGAEGVGSQGGTGALTRSSVTALSNGWYRFTVVGTLGGGITAAHARIFIAEGDNDNTFNGDGASYISLWGAQLEDSASFPTSYIPTTTASVTRAVDNLYHNLATVAPGIVTPGAATFYLKFIERGTYLGTSSRYFQISDAADAAPRLYLAKSSATNLQLLYGNGAANASVSLTSIPWTFGDTVEVRCVLASTGAVTLAYAINGAAEVVEGTSAAPAGGLAGNWSGNLLGINSIPNMALGTGAVALFAFKIARGSQSLAAMRTYA